ncbi:MAG: carbohydrate binding domain-containing protein [Bacteroidaceae bacterium]|nr:carbohydrate binding domain-containing protein [Bacteroidaceae bacterium]
MKKLLVSLLCGFSLTASAQVDINIDINNKGPKISPTHYGIFFEDINHAADGGLYAELIQNRSMEDSETQPVHWNAVHNSQSKSVIELTAEDPLNGAHQKSLRVMITAADEQNLAGVQNDGYWGINVVKGREYKLSFWAKSDKKYKGVLKALLRSQGEVRFLGEVNIPVKLNEKWQKFTTIIKATGNDPKAVFELLANTPGTFQLDVVSLFPPTFKGRENGMRPDLAHMLADMKPKFMRFPGGCFVEGQQSPENAFRWERTIGPIEERPGHKNVNWGYRTTDGIGFHEYLQLAEDLGARPLYVVNVGIWHGGYTPLDSLQSWIDECMNALEYANGDITTKYGAMRAKNGHPEPFNIEYLEIGNENYNFHPDTNRDQSINYPERYKMFYDAIKAKYPNMVCIGNVESWGTDNPSWRNDYPVEMVDEHYYRNPQWFAERFHKYDNYDRNRYKVYVGEYAVTSQFGKVGNLNAALGEAVYMMGMENNSDVVPLNSYAPIFVNENNVAWAPDMIRFNSERCMGTPSYYVQKLFPNNIGTRVIKTTWTEKIPQKPATNEVSQPVHLGLATWATNVTYKDPQYIVGGKATKLTELSKWQTVKGTWRGRDNEINQRSRLDPAMLISPETFTDKKYTYKVKAMKHSGNEGFLLMFGYADEDHYNWFNIGGWGNTQNNIEQGNGGGRIQLHRGTQFKVEDERWYDLQVDVDGDSITCFIDGKLECAGRLCQSMMKGVFASTTLDENTNELIIKIVNTGWGAVPGTIYLQNCKVQSATLERLSSENGTDENTMDNPTKIIPRTDDVHIAQQGEKMLIAIPSYSINIIRAKLK